MGNISELPEDLLLKILSFVPTKYIVATSLVSKSWRYLWTKVSKLAYKDSYHSNKTRFTRFLQESLLSHQPHALETLHIGVSLFPIDIRPSWIRTNVLCNLRELEVNAGIFGHISLPSVLFTCKKLVVLKLRGRIELSVPSVICLPSLKTLHVSPVKNLNDESIPRILTNCPLLSDLRIEHHFMSKLPNVMPWLLKLTIVTNSNCEPSPTLLDCYIRGLEIRTPSLKYLNFLDSFRLCVRVRIRSPSNFEDTSIYRRIVHLELSMGSDLYVELVIYLLKLSINLLVLNIKYICTPMDCWKLPSSVPTCLLSSLQTLEWRGYTGTCAEKEVVSYLLKHALCLKTAKIFIESYDLFEKQPMMDDLLSMPRGSTTCLLVFENE